MTSLAEFIRTRATTPAAIPAPRPAASDPAEITIYPMKRMLCAHTLVLDKSTEILCGRKRHHVLSCLPLDASAASSPATANNILNSSSGIDHTAHYRMLIAKSKSRKNL